MRIHFKEIQGRLNNDNVKQPCAVKFFLYFLRVKKKMNVVTERMVACVLFHFIKKGICLKTKRESEEDKIVILWNKYHAVRLLLICSYGRGAGSFEWKWGYKFWWFRMNLFSNLFKLSLLLRIVDIITQNLVKLSKTKNRKFQKFVQNSGDITSSYSPKLNINSRLKIILILNVTSQV